MEIKRNPYTETYTVTKSRDTYVSFDGIEFENSTDCIRHEEEIVEKLELPSLNPFVPMGINSIDFEDHVSWYLVKNNEELKCILEYYEVNKYDTLYYPLKNPMIICVVHGDYNNCIYDMGEAISGIKSFLNEVETIAKENQEFAEIYNAIKKEN